MGSKRTARRPIEGGDGDDFLKGTKKDDVIYGHDGADVIVGGLGVDLLFGGEGPDVFAFDDKDTGDVSFGRVDSIGDLSAEDTIDIRDTTTLYFHGFHVVEPSRGGFSIWQAEGNTYVTWNTFGTFHDVEITGYQGDLLSLLQQIRWYEDDYPGTAATDASIMPGETVTGTIEVSTDQDWFRIEIEQGLLYAFDMQGVSDGGGTLGSPFLTLYDQDGNFVASSSFGDIAFLADVSGSYFLAAQSFGGSTGSYTLEVTAEPYVDDFGDDVNTNGQIAPGETVNGVIGVPFDQDWFRIELEAGMIFHFDLQGELDGGGTLPGTALYLYDQFGNFVTNSIFDDLSFVADASEVYFIAAASFFEGTGTYTLEVTAEPA